MRTALHRAASQQAAVTVRDGLIDTPDGRRRVEVGAAPLVPRAAAPMYLVTFHDHPDPPPARPAGGPADGRLEDELVRTRDELGSALEEMQTAAEEARASHEELTSVNEELQSANEELETSKEELQSLNEELTTVNAQLQSKMAELESTGNDLASLLTSTDIAVLFLELEFRIRRFTPAVRDLLDLIPSDAGRPLADLRRKFADPDLVADAQQVLDRLAPVEREVASDSGRAYLRRALPYRTRDDRIDGVVVVFVDVTDRRRVEAARRESEDKYRTLFAAVDEAFCVIEVLPDPAGGPADYRFLEVNPAFEGQAGITAAVGRRMREIAPAHEPFWVDTYVRVADTGEPVRFQHAAAALGRHFDVYAVRVGPADQRRVAVLFTDITGRRRLETGLAVAAAADAFRVRLADALRPLTDPVAVEVEATRVLGEHLGVGRAFYCEVEPDGDHVLIHRDFTAAGTASIAGRQRLSSFGPHWVEGYRAGRTLATSDTRDIGGSPPAAFEAIAVRACVGVPVTKGGRFVGVLIVHSATPRDWTPLEVALVEEAAERTWAAVERAKAEDAMRASEERLRAVADGLPNAAVFVVGHDLRYILAAGEALEPAGFSSAALEGKTVAEGVGQHLAAEYELRYRRALGGEPFRADHYSHGRHYASHGVPLRDDGGRVTAVLAVSYDITDRVRAEAALRAAKDELENRVRERTAELAGAVRDLQAEATERVQAEADRRELLARLEVAQEEERTRIARELHDSLGQYLTGMSLGLTAVRRLPPGPGQSDQLDRLLTLTAEIGREVHRLATELRPTALDDVGLVTAVQSLVAGWAERTGVPVEFDSTGLDGERPPEPAATTAYRAVQEALTNVLKHAAATRVSVVLSRTPDALVAVVEDDGRGFDPDAPPDGGRRGLGLRGMHERIAQAGGTLQVESSPGAGTTVYVRIPLPPPETSHG